MKTEAKPGIAPALQEYKNLLDTVTVNPSKVGEIDYVIKLMTANKGRYMSVAQTIGNGIPWWFIAIVHVMEKGGKFTGHLHNGDPLTARTVNVPAMRPVKGKPPFTWEYSAEDAIRYMKYDLVKDWSMPNCLYLFEKYNGFGYRNLSKRKVPYPNINSPYLWSYTNHYTAGKFVEDGKYDPAKVSKQPGCVAIIKRMSDQGLI